MGRKLLEQKSRIDPEQRYTPREALEPGADVVGSDDLAARIKDEGFMEFDVAVATPDQMRAVGQLGPVLGPRGLMPNPKSGTVTQDVGRAVEEIKRGKIEYRVDRYGIIHGVIGKKSFDLDSLVENYYALREELQRARPAPVKGRYFKTVALSTTMGPSAKVAESFSGNHAPSASAASGFSI